MTGRFASPETLVERAKASTGLDDFGPDDWKEGLEILAGELEKKHFHDQGLASLESRFVGLLSARLKVEDWTRSNPDYATGEIEGPLVILGLPRTATTALQNLLANDPHWRFVRGWEAKEPVPPPVLETEETDPRAEAERAWMAKDRTYAGKHIQRAGGPVDDVALLQLSFRNQDLAFGVPNYTRWWRDCDMMGAYAYHARILRLLQHRRPPNHWMIKAPWHNFHLDELIATYPNAKFIMTHRDPARIIPSVASLVQTAQKTLFREETIDPQAIGRFIQEHLQISVTRLMDFRRRHGDERFFDIYQGPFNANPMGELTRLYEWLGLPLADAADSLEQWAVSNRKGTHGEHRYTAEEFGVSESGIRDAFAGYIERFGIDAA